MPTPILESSLADDSAEATTATIVEKAPRKPYVAPLVASFELDPHDVGSADALTANG